MAFSIDYNALAAAAAEAIGGAGRTVTLIALDFDVDDASKPWLGPTNPRATPAKQLTIKAAFLPLAGNVKLGLSKQTMDLVKKADATVLIGTTEDLRAYQELIDSNGERYKITHLEELQPGDVRLMSFLVLNQ
jgi:hypothetical protein